tara:strand:- start:5105 stop:5338 length:234 start_codon:yes stop_codon:yes gene_type:complete
MKKTIFYTVAIFIMLAMGEIFFGVAFYLKDVKYELRHAPETVDFPYLYYSFKSNNDFVNDDGLYTKKSLRKKKKNTE